MRRANVLDRDVDTAAFRLIAKARRSGFCRHEAIASQILPGLRVRNEIVAMKSQIIFGMSWRSWIRSLASRLPPHPVITIRDGTLVDFASSG